MPNRCGDHICIIDIQIQIDVTDRSRRELDGEDMITHPVIVERSPIAVHVDDRLAGSIEAILKSPTSANVRRKDVESLMRSLGVEISERAGSRVRLNRDGVMLIIHKPHPRPDVKTYAVEYVREFLQKIGEEPEGN